MNCVFHILLNSFDVTLLRKDVITSVAHYHSNMLTLTLLHTAATALKVELHDLRKTCNME